MKGKRKGKGGKGKERDRMAGEREAEVTSSEEGWGERVGGIPVACFLAVLAGLREAFLQTSLCG